MTDTSPSPPTPVTWRVEIFRGLFRLSRIVTVEAASRYAAERAVDEMLTPGEWSPTFSAKPVASYSAEASKAEHHPGSNFCDDEVEERANIDALLMRYGVSEQQIAEFRAPYPS